MSPDKLQGKFEPGSSLLIVCDSSGPHLILVQVCDGVFQ
jgi:hypothetical protein